VLVLVLEVRGAQQQQAQQQQAQQQPMQPREAVAGASDGLERLVERV
jgi:hypothetical protein